MFGPAAIPPPNQSNSLGGGMTMAGGILEIKSTDLSGNSTDGRGGGLLLTRLGSPAALQTEIRDSVLSTVTSMRPI